MVSTEAKLLPPSPTPALCLCLAGLPREERLHIQWSQVAVGQALRYVVAEQWCGLVQ